MSKIKLHLEEAIENLAIETGYSFNFLCSVWSDECKDGDGDFEYFCAVTRERDW